MIHARINHGRVEVEGPIPAAWEGHLVKLVPLTPEDSLPDLEERFQALHAMGALEYEAGEVEAIASTVDEMNRVSQKATDRPPGRPR